jgi:hypothetical protein
MRKEKNIIEVKNATSSFKSVKENAPSLPSPLFPLSWR